MRSFLLSVFILLVGVAALPAQPGNMEGGAPLTNSTIRRSEDILTTVMELLDAASLDCLHCTWKSTVAPQGGDVLQLEARGANLSRIRQFFLDLGQHWTWDILSFSAKPALSDTSEPQVQFACDVTLAPGRSEEPAHVAQMFQTLGQMPFFAVAGGPPSSPNLFGCSFERGKNPGYQVIAPALDQLLTVQAGGSFPGRSHSLSRSSYLGQDLFNIDFTDQADGLLVPDIIGLFKTLAGAASLREVTVPHAPEKTPLVQVTLDVQPNQWTPIGEILAAGFGYDLLKADGRGETANASSTAAWTCVLLLHKGSGRGFPGPEIGATLAAGWPDALKSGLRFTWLPTSFRLTAQVAGEPDAAILKQVAEPLGFSYLGPQSRESLEANTMIVAFSHGQPAEAGGNQAVVAATKRVGEVIDHAVTPDGPRISVKLQFSEIPALIAQLRHEQACISQLNLECHPPDQAIIAYVQTEGNLGQTKRILRLAELLCESQLRWNRPLEEVANGLVLDGFTVNGGEEFQIRGSTMKNRQIFSELFPALQKMVGINTPFFREGKYSDYQGGRLMRFVVTARWNDPEK